MTNAYTLSDVRQCYGERCVLDVESLHVHEGEVFGIVGPSGAGKSTLLRLLNFLEAPTEGRIEYRNMPVGTDLPLAVRREVTTVFQRPMLLRRSVAANVRIGQRIRGSSPNDEAVHHWLDSWHRSGLRKVRFGDS